MFVCFEMMKDFVCLQLCVVNRVFYDEYLISFLLMWGLVWVGWCQVVLEVFELVFDFGCGNGCFFCYFEFLLDCVCFWYYVGIDISLLLLCMVCQYMVLLFVYFVLYDFE